MCNYQHACCIKALGVFLGVRPMIWLCVQDDGQGMARDALHRMLSFGFSDKEYRAGNVGRFGIGFKSGTLWSRHTASGRANVLCILKASAAIFKTWVT